MVGLKKKLWVLYGTLQGWFRARYASITCRLILWLVILIVWMVLDLA